MKLIAFFALAAIALARPPVDPEMQDILTDLIEEIDDHLTQPVMLKFLQKTTDTKVSAGDRLVLRCEATSTPNAVFQWFFNGKHIQGDKHLNVMEKLINAGKKTVESGIVFSQIVIPCASAANAGLYKCVAFNGYDKIESQAEVVVEGENAQCKPTHRVAPTITQWTDSRFEAEGNTATLTCRSSSATKHTTAWQNEDGAMINTQGGKFEVQDNGDLLIHNINWNDMGTYSCIASNKYGESRIESFLYPSKRATL